MCVIKQCLTLLWIPLLLVGLSSADFGPPYPVTGSWFKERFTVSEWNTTLQQFARVGGDTVLLRAPAVTMTTQDAMIQDPDFKWCYDLDPFGQQSDCAAVATYDLTKQGVRVAALATYRHEDNLLDSAVIKCSNYEKTIVTSRIYHRLVLPLKETTFDCDYNNTDVIVLFTSFAGIDPQELLLPVAEEYNMSVYLGLPIPPLALGIGLTDDAYMDFISRLIQSHKSRFDGDSPLSNNSQVFSGYFWSGDIYLSDIDAKHGKLNLLNKVGKKIHHFGKLFGLSATGVLTKRFGSSVSDLAIQFKELAQNGELDLISVKDGRGSATSALYWETQLSTEIKTSDPGLFKILKDRVPDLNETATYGDMFYGSTHEIFAALENTTSFVNKNNSRQVQLWLSIEAFDSINDDPCLPVDHAQSGNDRMSNRVSKSRLDQVLTHTGWAITKVLAFAWDPDFTCTTKNYSYSLRTQIASDSDRPIIAHCGFHSSFNRSVVVIGHALAGLTQSFEINWPHVGGHRVKSEVHGYYFELDWGVQHGRVPSLMYVQTYDPYYDVNDLAPKGYVRVIAHGSYHACVFRYDFTANDSATAYTKHENRRAKKRFVREVKTPRLRVEAQDVRFTKV